MRVLIKATIPVEAGNAIIKKGRLGETMQSILAELKPEAAYFGAENGKRTAYIITDISDPSRIPSVGEPLFLALHADVEFHPVMVADDLMKAQSDIKQAVQRYGSVV